MLPLELTPPFPFALACFDASTTRFSAGDIAAEFEFASVTKLFAARAFLIALERGVISLEETRPVGAPSQETTFRQLISHVSGVSFDTAQRCAPAGSKRVYTNYAFDEAASWVSEKLGTSFVDWLDEQVVAPLELQDTYVPASVAHSGRGSVRDLVRFGQELLAPQLVSEAWAQQARTVQFPGLRGVTPGFGFYPDNQWGLGMEIRGQKRQTWFPSLSEDATFGHFGRAGSFLWVAPESGFGAAFLGAEPTGEWHKSHWSALNDWLLRTYL